MSLTIGVYPLSYARTMDSIGDIYMNLSELREKDANMERAVDSYDKALEVFTVEKYPLVYQKIVRKRNTAKKKLTS